MNRVVRVIVSLGVGVGLVAAPSTAHAETNGPALETFPASVLYGIAHPGVSPKGSNDWNCTPSAAHPRPVVLVHGTWASQFNSWSYLSPRLEAAGYCVFSLNFGKSNAPIGLVPEVYGTAAVMDSARELGSFVDRVRTQTGAAKVDLVGYSQGGIVARGYLKFFGGADAANPANNRVKKVVTYGATNHGTTLSGLATLAAQLNLMGSRAR